jgi:hypothetical protein
VNALWLLSGGYPGEVHHDINFMTYVERLDVNIDYLRLQDWMTDEVNEILEAWQGGSIRADRALAEAPMAVIQGIEERIRDFWRTLQQKFPRATHIIASDNTAREASKYLPYLFKRIVQICPTGISVSASLLQGGETYNCRLHRSLWRQVKGDCSVAGEWEQICPIWTQQKIILLPNRRFRGRVGTYKSIYYKAIHHDLQITAARVLLIVALERYYFHEQHDHKGFGCFAPGCDAWFERPEEYTSHAIQTRHDESAVPPENVKTLFEKNRKRLERLQEELRKAWYPIIEYWGEDGSEKRDNAEQAFLHQLERDPMYAQGKPAMKSEAWAGIQMVMN